MSKGRVWDDPQFRYTDAYSGREVIQLTDYLGHTNHFYFTDPSFFNNDESFIFVSDRENRSNFFRYDLADGKITQLTDFQTPGRSGGQWSEANKRLYYWRDGKLTELNPETFEEREIYEEPVDMSAGRASPTADGKYILTRLQENVPEEKASISFAYSRFHELFHKQPLAQVMRIEIATGKSEIIHEDNRYMSHINTSPKVPHIMTYCHEGPWHLVKQRIWGLNIETGETWKIRPQDDGLELAVGHEYWFEDGETLGYHGFPREDRNREHVFGHIKWDNSEHVERRFPFRSTHFHSLGDSIIVGDGTPAAVFGYQGAGARPFIQLFKWDGKEYVGPHILAYHRSTFNNQHAHPHPRFTPDGKYIMYSSDLTNYSNIYLVEVGDFEDLPLLTDDVQPQHT